MVCGFEVKVRWHSEGGWVDLEGSSSHPLSPRFLALGRLCLQFFCPNLSRHYGVAFVVAVKFTVAQY